MLSSTSCRIFFILLLVLLAPKVWAEPTGGDKDAFDQYQRIEFDPLTQKKSYLNRKERTQLLSDVSKHPVTNLANIGDYDKEGIIGFCFGRAMGAHLMARKTFKLKSEAIKKLFIIGDLRQGKDPEWRFHVTTLVLGAETRREKPRWYAIDPIMTPPVGDGKPILLEKWVENVRRVWDKKEKPEDLAKLYMTSSFVVMPDVTLDINGHTGDVILELVFDPTKKKGFFPEVFGKETAFKMAEESVEDNYMISVRESKDRFNFDKITIDGKDIVYNEYFTKLLGDISGDSPIERKMAPDYAEREAKLRAIMTGPKPQMFSPKFFKQSEKASQ